MIARPCNINARCVPCAESSSPYQNLSAEAPDPINYIGIAFVQSIPRENQEPQIDQTPTVIPLCPWCITNIVGSGTGTTQNNANQNAQTSGQQQLAGEQGVALVGNTAYGGAVPCAGGGSSSYTIPAGTYFGNTQEEADALAQSNFDELAFSNTICISTTSLPSTCTDGGDYEQTITATGGVIIELGHYVFEVSAGSLPPGFALDLASGLISGDPNASVPGTYTFTVTVSDDLSNNASRDYTISIISISPTASDLPDATNGTAYSQQLTIDPPTLTGTFALTGGAFPTGITMDATGLISGTPSVGGAFSVTIAVTIESVGITCSKTYTLNCWSYTTKDSTAITINTAGDTVTGAIGGVTWGPGTYRLIYKPTGSSPMQWFEQKAPINAWVASLGGTSGDCSCPAIILKATGVSVGTLTGYTMSDPSSGATAAAECVAAMAAANVLIEFTLTAVETLTLTWPQLVQPICVGTPTTGLTAPSGTGLVTSLYVLG